MKGKIQQVRPKSKTGGLDKHIASLFGHESVPKRSYYRDVESGREFWEIQGAIAWPEMGKIPGYILIMGVVKGEDTENLRFLCLDEVESVSAAELLEACVKLREKWGFWECPSLLRKWYGNPERLVPIVSNFNATLQGDEKNVEKGFYVVPPIGWETKTWFETYLARIHEMFGQKRLHIGTCNRLRNHLQLFSSKDARQREGEDFPPIAALGYALHSLLILKPWSIPVEGREPEFETVATFQGEFTRRHLRIDDFNLGEDDGLLLPTFKASKD